MVLDQSPLGVDAAHERVLLQHLLQACRPGKHSCFCCVGMATTREGRVYTACHDGSKAAAFSPLWVFSEISALSSFTLTNFTTLLLGVAAAVSSSSSSFLCRFLPHNTNRRHNRGNNCSSQEKPSRMFPFSPTLTSGTVKTEGNRRTENVQNTEAGVTLTAHIRKKHFKGKSVSSGGSADSSSCF